MADIISTLINTALNWREKAEARNYNENQDRIQRQWEEGEAEAQRTFNSAEAQKNRDWLTEMSNTEVQRRVSDMRSAGINPILAANYGGSTPSANAATSSGTNAVQGSRDNSRNDNKLDLLAILKAKNEMELNSATKQKVIEEKNTIQATRDAAIANTNSATEYNRQKTETEKKIREQADQQIEHLKKETGKAEKEEEILRKKEKHYEADRTHTRRINYWDKINDTIKAIGSFL